MSRITAGLLVIFVLSASVSAQSISEALAKLRDPRSDVRLAAVTTFLRLDPSITKTSEGKDVVAGLTDAVGDRDYRVRAGVLAALGRLHPDPAPLLPVLIRAARDPLSTDPAQRLASVHSRIGALVLMATLGADDREVVPLLAEALRDDETSVRQNVANVLGRYKGDASAALPALKRALGDSDPSVRTAAAAAIARIEGGQSR